MPSTVLISGKTKARKPKKRGRPVRPKKSAEVEYRLAIQRMNKLLKRRTEQIGEMVTNGESPSAISRQLRAYMREASESYDANSETVSNKFIKDLSDDNKAKIEKSLKDALGVDLVKVLDTPEVKEALDLAIIENTNLIRSLETNHYAKVGDAVLKNFRGEKLSQGNLVDELTNTLGITERRAKFIARDQNSKIVSSLNQIRQSQAGVKKYIWRNAGDIKVTGYPGGKNKPSASHGDHWAREGKVFSWDKPPPDGHAGQPPGCRCFPEPIIEIEEVEANAIRA